MADNDVSIPIGTKVKFWHPLCLGWKTPKIGIITDCRNMGECYIIEYEDRRKAYNKATVYAKPFLGWKVEILGC